MPDMSINITAQSEQFKEQSGYVSPICLMLQGPIPDCIRPQPRPAEFILHMHVHVAVLSQP